MKTHILFMPAPAGQHTIHFIAICLLFISACSLFKEKSFYQADSLRLRNTSREIKEDFSSQTQALRMYTRSDSTEKQYEAEIFPKGPFKYSPAEGFTGMAERLFIKGRIKEEKLVHDSAMISRQSNLRSETKETQKDKIKTRSLQKERKVKDNRPVFLAGGILLLLVLIFVLRKFLK